MSTIKIYTPSGEKIYFHDVVEAKGDRPGMIKITQGNGKYSSEAWIIEENITCMQTFITETDAAYFEPIPTEEKEKPKDNDNEQTYSIMPMVVSVVCLIAVIIMALI